MPIVRKPPYPQTKLDIPAVATTYRTEWDLQTGGIKSETVLTRNFNQYTSILGNRTRNKPILLATGELWKRVTDYRATYVSTTRLPGTIRWDGRQWWWPQTVPDAPLVELRGPSNADNGTLFQYVRTEGSFRGLNTDLTPIAQDANLRNRLATEVMMKVGSRKASFGESLAESRQTANHLAKTATTLVKAALAARKGDWWSVARTLKVTPKRFKSGKSASERWLEYQYGWMPLMGDIYDASELLKKGFREKAQIASSVRAISNSYSGSSEDSKGQILHKRAARRDTVKVFYRIDESALSNLNQMGLINPLEVAWALVPFSFVFDWFVPVGNFLEALSARFGVTFIDGYYGTKVTSTCRFLHVPGNPVGGKLVVNDVWTITDISSYTRTKIHGFPIPGLYWKNPFSSSHVLSAAALIRQLRW